MKRYGIIVALLLIGAALLWFAEWKHESKYRYKGHSARYWILQKNQYSPRSDKEYALANLGSNAVPAALDLLNAKDYSLGDRIFLRILPNLPKVVQNGVVKIYPLVPLNARKLKAAEALGIIGPEARVAIPSLIGAFSARDPQLPFVAANALGKIGKDSVPMLVEGLQSVRPLQNRVFIIDALGTIGPDARDAIPPLINFVYKSDRTMARAAADALGKIGPEAVPPLLDEWQTSDSKHNRPMIITALGAIGHGAGAAVPEVVDALYDPNCDVEARFAIAKIGTAALPILFSMFTNNLPLERTKAVNAFSLAAPRDPKVFAALVTATQDVDSSVRQQAAQSLGRLAPENKFVVPPLMAMLSDPELPVQLEAMKALGHAGINGAPAVPQLIRCLSETNLTVQEQACLALAEIGRPAKSGMEAMSPLMQSSDPAVRRAASMSLAALKQFP